MKDFKKIVKENKKRALSIAVATAFAISGPLGLAGCYDEQKDEDEEQNQNGTSSSGGVYHGGWHSFGGSSGAYSSNNASVGNDSSNSDKSSITNTPDGHSSGYSGIKGGSSSS